MVALREPAVTLYLARVDGVPAALAKATTFDGATYLASIGTRPAFQGRGLGGLVTRAAVADALASGSRWVYLGVFEAIRAKQTGRELGPFEGEFPTVEDGARGVRFIERVIESGASDRKWLEI